MGGNRRVASLFQYRDKLRETYMKKYTIEELREMRISKEEAFKELRDSDEDFDFSLPQSWLEGVVQDAKKYLDLEEFGISLKEGEDLYAWVRSTTVWAYLKGRNGRSSIFGCPVSCCAEIQALLDGYPKPE